MNEFLDASLHLYEPLCLSVCPSVRPERLAKTKEIKETKLYIIAKSFFIAIVVIVIVLVSKLSLWSLSRKKGNEYILNVVVVVVVVVVVC